MAAQSAKNDFPKEINLQRLQSCFHSNSRALMRVVSLLDFLEMRAGKKQDGRRDTRYKATPMQHSDAMPELYEHLNPHAVRSSGPDGTGAGCRIESCRVYRYR